jgi:hypothetical protein
MEELETLPSPLQSRVSTRGPECARETTVSIRSLGLGLCATGGLRAALPGSLGLGWPTTHPSQWHSLSI